MFTRLVFRGPLVLLLVAIQSNSLSAQAVRKATNLNLLKMKLFEGDLTHNNLVRKTFTPPLIKALTAELHFVKKLCKPTDEQFEKIHRAGLAEVNQLAQLFAIQQRARTKAPEVQDPNTRIGSALRDAVEELMPDSEVVDRYAEELEARTNARRAATAGMIVTMIDQAVFLDPAQQDQLTTTLLENWSHRWSSSPIIVMYPTYLTLPSEELLHQHLTPVQQRLWTYRPAQRKVRLPWDFELNVRKMLPVKELEPFPDPKPSVEEARQ